MNAVKNGDFEGNSSVIPYWKVIEGTAGITTGFAGSNAIRSTALPFTVRQDFSPSIKAGFFSFWQRWFGAGANLGSFTLFYEDGTSGSTTLNHGNGVGWIKIQQMLNPPKYVTAIELHGQSGFHIVFDEVQLWEESLLVEESDQPKISAQIFRGVHPQSEDNFLRGAISDGSGSAHTDGDILTLYFTGSANFTGFRIPTIPQTFIDVQNTYKTMVARLRGNASYAIYLKSGSGTYTVQTNTAAPSDWTIKTYDLSASTITPDVVDIYTSVASQGQFTQWDYVLFTTGSYMDITEDLVSAQTKRATVDAGSFNIELRNDKIKYLSGSNKINYWDDVLIYGGYKSATGSLNYEKIFGGKIEELTPTISPQGSVLTLSGRGYGIGLVNTIAFASYGLTGSLIPTATVQPNLGNIAQDLIDRFTNASGTGYRLEVGLSGSTGDTTNTIGGWGQWMTGSRIEYYETRQRPVWDGLKELAELYWASQSTGSGLIIGDTPIQSLEYYISPAGVIHFEQMANTTIRGRKFGKTLAVGDNILDIKPQTDINNMKNKIRYFSTFWLPPDGDGWTENTAGSWTGSAVFPFTLTDTTNRIIGNKSVSCYKASAAFITLDYPKDSNLNINTDTLGSPISIPYLSFYHRCQTANVGPYELDIYILTDNGVGVANVQFIYQDSNGNSLGGSDQNRFVYSVGTAASSTSAPWYHTTIPIGRYAPSGSDSTSFDLDLFNAWQVYSTSGGRGPDWTKIRGISFRFNASGSTNMSGSIDGLRLEGFRYDIAKDSTSISKYGLREAFITDPIIKDSGSAPKFAKAELFKFRVPITRGTIRTRFYPTMHPGQLVTVNYPDGNINNQDYRIIRVNHDMDSRGFVSNCEINSDTGSQTPLDRTKIISYITQGAGLSSRSINDLMNAPFDPFMTPNEVDFPS